MPTPPSAARVESAIDEEFAAAVRRGLTLPQKQLEPLYFYDALGSALFDAITRLPEYTITRAELELLGKRGSEMLATLGGAPEFIELGPGNGEKLERLLAACAGRKRVHLIDISTTALQSAETRLHERGDVEATTFAGTFADGLQALPHGGGCRLVLFLGSSLGNFAPTEAAAFLLRIRESLEPGDALLLGVDLVKPEPALLAAYDDPLGVTAAFNKNLLARINRELGADFDLLGFDHRALWNAAASRVEMHLVSLVEQCVSIRFTDQRFAFRAGETIWTESSHKYEPAGIASVVQQARFHVAAQWLNEEHAFLEMLCAV
jgi:dimethylhistidine N-methyltransferase